MPLIPDTPPTTIIDQPTEVTVTEYNITGHSVVSPVDDLAGTQLMIAVSGGYRDGGAFVKVTEETFVFSAQEIFAADATIYGTLKSALYNLLLGTGKLPGGTVQ